MITEVEVHRGLVFANPHMCSFVLYGVCMVRMKAEDFSCMCSVLTTSDKSAQDLLQLNKRQSTTQTTTTPNNIYSNSLENHPESAQTSSGLDWLAGIRVTEETSIYIYIYILSANPFQILFDRKLL